MFVPPRRAADAAADVRSCRYGTPWLSQHMNINNIMHVFIECRLKWFRVEAKTASSTPIAVLLYNVHHSILYVLRMFQKIEKPGVGV